MDARIAESNAWGTDLHIPIHTNVFNGTVMGTRMFCHTFGGVWYKVCKAVFDELTPITPRESDGIKESPAWRRSAGWPHHTHLLHRVGLPRQSNGGRLDHRQYWSCCREMPVEYAIHMNNEAKHRAIQASEFYNRKVNRKFIDEVRAEMNSIMFSTAHDTRR